MIDRSISHKTVRTLAAAFLLALLTVIAAHWSLTQQLFNLQKKDTILQDKIAATALILQEVDLTRKKEDELIHFQEKVAKYANKTSEFLQELAKNSAKSVCFTHLSRSKNKMEWQGYALSPSALLAYLKHLMSAKQFSDMTVESLQREAMQEKVHFKIRAEEFEGLSFAENEGKSK